MRLQSYYEISFVLLLRLLREEPPKENVLQARRVRRAIYRQFKMRLCKHIEHYRVRARVYDKRPRERACNALKIRRRARVNGLRQHLRRSLSSHADANTQNTVPAECVALKTMTTNQTTTAQGLETS